MTLNQSYFSKKLYIFLIPFYNQHHIKMQKLTNKECIINNSKIQIPYEEKQTKLILINTH